MDQLLETVQIFSERPAMRHQLASLAKLVKESGTAEDQQIADDVAQEFHITQDDFDRVPSFWMDENLKRMK